MSVPQTNRVVFQLADEHDAEQLPADVRAVLAQAGVVDVKSPHPDVLPGLFVAVVPADVDADALVRDLAALPAVRNAEPDQLQGTF